MSFWTEPGLEPKRNFRWRVTIPLLSQGGGSTSVIWWAKNFKPPSYEISEASHQLLDNTYYFPGRLTWTECTMTMVDPVSPNAAQLTNQIILNAGFSIKGPQNFAQAPTSMSKRNSVGATGNVVVDVISSDAVVIEKWTLHNPWLKSATYSDLAYDNDDLRTIDVSWRYDWAECENFDLNGVAVGNKQFGKLP